MTGANPGSVASIMSRLGDSDDKNKITLLGDVSPPTSVGMSLEETHQHMQRRLHNPLTLRETLSEEIALEISRSPAGRRYSYEACLQWFNTAAIDREYMAVAIST